ncbi:hypothetical protein pb186bvf_002618 [Paramecium bursaria]
MWRFSMRKCLNLPQCCSNKFLSKIAGTLKDWIRRMIKQMVSKIKRRIESSSAQERIIAQITESVSTTAASYDFKKLRNLPDNFNQMFYKQWLKCEEHGKHLNDEHLIKFHLKRGVDEFYKQVLACKPNEVSRNKIEKFIESVKDIKTLQEEKKKTKKDLKKK